MELWPNRWPSFLPPGVGQVASGQLLRGVNAVALPVGATAAKGKKIRCFKDHPTKGHGNKRNLNKNLDYCLL